MSVDLFDYYTLDFHQLEGDLPVKGSCNTEHVCGISGNTVKPSSVMRLLFNPTFSLIQLT
jgi:hypothetical protein